ncbi:hypothetical protein ACN20G_24600 [Streptomyces sp. BI20]|uniref:hypothetical protein n=1 Tax=Streptomyces sp. BI20 TaxID=3403460 RepID=UPI003C725949
MRRAPRHATTHPARSAPARADRPAHRPRPVRRDPRPERRVALGLAALTPTLLNAVDLMAGRAHPTRALGWCALGLLVLAVLWPARVELAPGRLLVRGLLVRRALRTDRVTGLALSEGLVPRLLLRDADGRRAALDPALLVEQPRAWAVLDADLRASEAAGALRTGTADLATLRRRVERATLERMATLPTHPGQG